MSGDSWYPPPGWSPPPGQQPPPPPGSWPPPPPPGWAAPPPLPPGMLGAAHKPGALPLRPLGLGDIYDAAFKIIRFNPRATVGAAALLGVVTMALPVLAAALVAATIDLSADTVDTTEAVGLIAALVTGALGVVLYYAGSLFVTGMVARVTAAAAIGRRLSLGEAWSQTHGNRWRLVGLTAVIGLGWGVLAAAYAGVSVLLVVLVSSLAVRIAYFALSVPVIVALACWLWIRVTYLPVPALMIERGGVFAALGRGYRLTRRQFWRTFGIALLTGLITGVAGQVISVPVSIVVSVVGAVAGPQVALFSTVLGQALAVVVSSAFVTPFTAAVTSVQYLDQRMRKEAYDVELMTQAGITAS